MNQTTIIKTLLENAGLRVEGITDGFIIMEDPACVLRGFQTFLDDAWIVLTVITGFMIMIWGIAKIRGAKFSEINYFKTLTMIFIVLSLMWPILNLIYGGNLLGIGCKKIKVPLDEVQNILTTRFGGNADALQYEDIDIYDSGPIYNGNSSEPTMPDIDYLLDDADRPDEELPQ